MKKTQERCSYTNMMYNMTKKVNLVPEKNTLVLHLIIFEHHNYKLEHIIRIWTDYDNLKI